MRTPGWLGCAVGAIAANPARGSRAVGIGAAALWVLTGVGSGRSDILVVDVLKHAFHRRAAPFLAGSASTAHVLHVCPPTCLPAHSFSL